MSADVVVRVSCDAPNCLAYVESRRPDASITGVRLAGVAKGWDFTVSASREFDLCPTHAKEVHSER